MGLEGANHTTASEPSQIIADIFEPDAYNHDLVSACRDSNKTRLNCIIKYFYRGSSDFSRQTYLYGSAGS